MSRNLDPQSDLVEHVKNYLESPPNFEKLVLAEYGPNDSAAQNYYFLRYQPGDMLVRRAQTLEALLSDTGVGTGLYIYGNSGDLWWNSIRGETIHLWIEREIVGERGNQVQRSCEAGFRFGMKILLLGINDVALTRDAIGKIEWNDDEFGFSVRSEPRERSTVFQGRVANRDEEGAVDLFVQKRVDNYRGEGELREFNYRYKLEFSDPDGWDYPSRITSWIIPPEEPERIISVSKTITAKRADRRMPSRLFRPDPLLLESAEIYHIVGSELVYQSGDEWRKVRSADDPSAIGPYEEVPGGHRMWYIVVAGVLLLPGVVFFLFFSNKPK